MSENLHGCEGYDPPTFNPVFGEVTISNEDENVISVREAYQILLDGLQKYREDHPDGEVHEFDVLYCQMVPRVKWFRPPMWRIFMWAYKINNVFLLNNCYPAGMHRYDDANLGKSKSITIEWKSTPYHNENINKLANELERRLGINAKVSESIAE